VAYTRSVIASEVGVEAGKADVLQLTSVNATTAKACLACRMGSRHLQVALPEPVYIVRQIAIIHNGVSHGLHVLD